MTNQEKGIQWTDFTSNPIKYRDEAGKSVWACVKVSDGCKNCYAETLAKRYGRGGPFSLPQTKKVTAYFDAKEANSLLKSTKITGKRVFIGDMTDIFGDWVSDEILDKLFAVFALRPDVTFQILTKRPERMAKYTTTPFVSNRILEAMHVVDPKRGVWAWPGWDDAMRNVWFGTSVENQKAADERIPWLLKCPAAVRFLSAEPLLGPIDFSKWIGHNPRHENKQNGGIGNPRSNSKSGIGNRQGGKDLENCEARMGSVAEENSNQTMPPGTSGKQKPAGLSSNTDNEEQTSRINRRSSDGILVLGGSDSGAYGNQSQERDEGRQQAGESGSGELFREYEACLPNGPVGRTRGAKPGSEIEQPCSGNDPGGIRERRSYTEDSCGTVWGSVPTNITSGSGGPQAKTNWKDGGLYESPKPSLSLIIAGGESGPGARPCNLEWIRSIVRQCREAGVACFVKQLGADAYTDTTCTCGHNSDGSWKGPTACFACAGRLPLKDSHGGDMSEWPEDIRIRQFPAKGQP